MTVPSAIKNLGVNLGKRCTYRVWSKVRQSSAWPFVHPWERKFVEEKLEKGWEVWSVKEARELVELLIVVGRRMVDLSLRR